MLDSILIFGFAWTVMGILYLTGLLQIPKKYINTEYESDYRKVRGLMWLMIGVPWSLAFFIMGTLDPAKAEALRYPVLIVITLPGFIYGIVMDKKFEKLMKK